MQTEITAFIVALSHATKVAKAAIHARDEAKRREALAELTSAFADLQAKHLTIIQNQQALIEQNEALRKKLADYDKWEQERARYVLKQVPSGGFVYALDPAQKANDPPHWLCPNCYNERHKSILQSAGIETGERTHLWMCPRCKSKAIAHGHWPETLK